MIKISTIKKILFLKKIVTPFILLKNFKTHPTNPRTSLTIPSITKGNKPSTDRASLAMDKMQ